MVIGILTLELRIPGSQSLKEKRMVLKSLKDRIRNSFNVSVAEIGNLDKWQLATIGVSYIGNEREHVDRALAKVVDFVERSKESDIVDYITEII